MAFALLIYGMTGLTGPRTAVRGNKIAAVGMAVAVVAPLLRRLLADRFGWRSPFIIFSIVGLLHGLVLMRVLRNAPAWSGVAGAAGSGGVWPGAGCADARSPRLHIAAASAPRRPGGRRSTAGKACLSGGPAPC